MALATNRDSKGRFTPMPKTLRIYQYTDPKHRLPGSVAVARNKYPYDFAERSAHPYKRHPHRKLPMKPVAEWSDEANDYRPVSVKTPARDAYGRFIPKH